MIEKRTEPVAYVPKSEEVLKEIALGIIEGRIFCDRQIDNKEHVPLVFMILALMDEQTAEQLKVQDVCLIYEYINKSGPMGINGMPTFFSMRCLNRTDTEKMMKYYEEADKMRKEFLGTPEDK